MQRIFRRANLEDKLWIARNGLEALELLHGTTVPRYRRVVLMDINMPKMNGLEALAQIRKDYPFGELAVMILTTSNNEKDKQEAYKLNACGYFVKPTSFAEFVDLVSIISSYWSKMEFS